MRIILRLFSVFLSVILVFVSTVAAHESSEENSISLYSAATVFSAEASSVQYAMPKSDTSSKSETSSIPIFAKPKGAFLLGDASSVIQYSPISFSGQGNQVFLEKYSYKAAEDILVVLAKVLYGEANNASKMEKAAVIWTILNRVDSGYGELISVATNRSHYNGYNKNHPITDENKALCLDVLCRYYAEKDGYSNVGRVLPPDYMWFRGDGEHNYFRNAFRGGEIWNWSLPNPYV